MPAPDRVLRRYLECPDEQSADDLLAGLLFDNAEPVVCGILQSRLRGAAGPREREDLAGDVILDLQVGLHRDRLSREKSAIASFLAYVTRAAHRACDEFFRRRYPQRHHLKNRVRYVARETPRFAIWTDANGATACGLARWKGRTVVEFSGCHVPVKPSEPLAAALEAIFEDAGGPVELDDVAAFLAAAWGIRSLRTPIESLGMHADAGADERGRLERLWAGIAAMPLSQRRASLLHMRDDRGGPALALLPPSGVASIPRIADALEMPPAQLAEMWNRLPLGDAEIGSQLGLTRRQVIDLRGEARRHLAQSGG